MPLPFEEFRNLFDDKKDYELRAQVKRAIWDVIFKNDDPINWTGEGGVLSKLWDHRVELDHTKFVRNLGNLKAETSAEIHYIYLLYWIYISQEDSDVCRTEFERVCRAVWKCGFDERRAQIRKQRADEANASERNRHPQRSPCDRPRSPPDAEQPSNLNRDEEAPNSGDDRADQENLTKVKQAAIFENAISKDDLIPIDALLTDDEHDILDPFNRHENAIKLKRRDRERGNLRDFADNDARFQLCALIGPSGSGKTRLAVEWSIEYDGKGWNAAFLKNPSPDIWAGWKPTADTLIVIDYMFNYDEAINTIMRHCKDLPDDHPKVRLLVLDHIFADDIRNLGHFSYWRNIVGDKNELKALIASGVVHPSTPILLKDATDRAVLLREIVMDVSDIDDEDDPKIADAMKIFEDESKDEVRHPLFAALVGDAIKQGWEDYSVWSRLDIIDYYMDGKNRIPWVESHGAAGQWAGVLIAAATVWGDADWEELKRILPDPTGMNGQDGSLAAFHSAIEQFCTHLLSSRLEGNVLKAFRPDILGELFVLRFLRAVNRHGMLTP